MKPRRIAILGAAGAIGSRLVERWAHAGRAADVVAVVRSWSSAVGIARFPIEIRRADVEAGPQALADCLQGVEAVVDLTYPRSGNDRERERSGLTMAESVIEACARARVSSLVHLGSISSYGPLREPVHDERAPESPKDGYGLAKRAATRAMLEAARRGRVAALVLEPTVVFGPRTGWSAGTLATIPGYVYVLPELGEGRCPVVFVDDVCRAIECAFESGSKAVGHRYLVTGPEEIGWTGFFEAHAAVAGREGTVWATMPLEEIRQKRKEREKSRTPLRRVAGLLRENAEIRGALLALPGLAQIRSTVRATTSDTRWQQIREALLASSGGRPAGGDLDQLLPGPIQERLFSWRGSIASGAAASDLGFRPVISFEAGMRVTAAWARWAGLASG